VTAHASVIAIAAKRACALRPDEENAEYDYAGKEEGVRAAGACPCQGRQRYRAGSYNGRADCKAGSRGAMHCLHSICPTSAAA
jgi:hypothetical protein